MKYAKILWGACLLLLVAVAPGAARAPTADHDGSSIHLFVENDWFGGTDRHYTNGVKLTWLSGDLGEASAGEPAALPGKRRNLAVSIGQKLFNPEDYQREELIEDDRPYAGWTFLSLAFHTRTERRLDVVALAAGIVGPSSLGEESQKATHRLVNDPLPRGWDNQLHDEPGLMLAWRRYWRLPVLAEPGGWEVDVIPQVGATAGNIYTFANLGSEIRLGRHLPSDFGSSLIFPASLSEPLDYRERRRTNPAGGIYLFGRVEGRAVARDIFLDGNTFEESHSVDKKPLVADLAVGIGFIWKRVKLTYAHVYRTQEFEEQDGGQTFGSINLAVSF